VVFVGVIVMMRMGRVIGRDDRNDRFFHVCLLVGQCNYARRPPGLLAIACY
jgi:hypothetical protein